MTRRENYKPRIGLKQSLRSFFEAPMRYLKESNLVESVFEKPYLDLDYLKMHLNLPVPDWPSRERERPVPTPQGPFPRNPRPEDEEEAGKCDCCFLVWWGECDDEDHNGGLWLPPWHPDLPWSPETHRWVIKGDYKNFREYPPHPGATFPGLGHAAYFDYDETLVDLDGYVFVTLCYEIGGICEHCVDFWAECCACTTENALTFDDDNTSDTIVADESIAVYVLNGCPPFSWSVAESEFSFSSGITNVRSNTLSATAAACGKATLTITDRCGTEVTAYIRCTTGSWGTCRSSAIGGYTPCGVILYCYTSPACRTKFYCTTGTPPGWDYCGGDCLQPEADWCDSTTCACKSLCQAESGCGGAYSWEQQTWQC